ESSSIAYISRISRVSPLFLSLSISLQISLFFTFFSMGSPHLTPAIRERICELHSAAQWGYKRIHQRYPWISLSTIRYTIKKEHERRAGVSKPRSGRPKKLNATDKTQSRRTRVLVTREDLLTKVSYKVKIDSIRRLLNTENLRK
ncbi:hypothetical protein N7527_011493, partial [Penicillium freii]